MKTFADAQNYLYSFIDYEKKLPTSLDGSGEFNLQNFKLFLEALNNPHDQLTCIHIAGTKGKGSVATYIANILRASGRKVGLFTSPHIETIKERFKINGENISDEDFVKQVKLLKKAVEKTNYKRDGYYRTAFELMTALGFLYFLNSGVDIAVIETGLGGRLDCTNVITPILSVITTIDFDHMYLLGDTIESIAYEKAGIIKPNIPALLAIQTDNKDAIEGVVRKTAQENNAPLHYASDVTAINKRTFSPNKQIVSATCFDDEFDFELSMNGIHQVYNALTAIVSTRLLREQEIAVSDEDVKIGLKRTTIPGRIEIIYKDKVSYLLDGAHCPISASVLRRTVNELFGNKKLIILLNILNDKDINGVIKNLVGERRDHAIYVFQSDNPRGGSPEYICEIARQHVDEIKNLGTLRCALDQARMIAADQDRLVIVAGSLYNIQPAKRIIEGDSL